LIYISGSKKLYFSEFNKHSSKFFNIFLMPIQHFFYPSPIGILQIKASDEAILSVVFLNTSPLPAHAVKMQSPGISGQPLIDNCLLQLNDYFYGQGRNFTLPLRQHGTDFQQQVWLALTDIPYGITISYLELSKRINKVKAIRAVGIANGQNSIALMVPCHRVIGTNGSLTGYRGGVWRKRWLLEHEAAKAHGVRQLF